MTLLFLTIVHLLQVNLNKKYGLMTQSPHPILASDGVYTVGQGVGVTGPKYCIVKFPSDGGCFFLCYFYTNGKCVVELKSIW